MLSCSPSKSEQRPRVSAARTPGVRRALAAPPSGLDGWSWRLGVGSQWSPARAGELTGRINSRLPYRLVDGVRCGQDGGGDAHAHARTAGQSLCVMASRVARHRRIVRTIGTMGSLHHGRHGRGNTRCGIATVSTRAMKDSHDMNQPMRPEVIGIA